MSDAQQQTQQKHRLYGRAAGKPLSKRQQALVDDLLPKLAIPEAGQGELFPAVLFSAATQSVWLEIGFGGGSISPGRLHAIPRRPSSAPNPLSTASPNSSPRSTSRAFPTSACAVAMRAILSPPSPTPRSIAPSSSSPIRGRRRAIASGGWCSLTSWPNSRVS